MTNIHKRFHRIAQINVIVNRKYVKRTLPNLLITCRNTFSCESKSTSKGYTSTSSSFKYLFSEEKRVKRL